ncbi:MAG: sigma-70 family RNA polymerase sigma factor [Spirosomataceae bacterium]
MEQEYIADEGDRHELIDSNYDFTVGDSVIKDPEVLVRKTILANFDLGVEKLFHCYYAPICNHAIRFVSSREIAEDIVSDVFSSCYTNHRFTNIRTSYRAYLFNAVRNRAFNFVKAELKRNISLENVKYMPIDIDEQPDEFIHYKEMYHDVENAIDQLAPKRRSVYIMRRIEGMEYDEIAQELNISLKTVKEQVLPVSAQSRNTSVWVDKVVKGRVSDENGQPLPGVTVMIKNTEKGTATGINGEFELSVSDEQLDNGSLLFSFIGYETQEVAINGRTAINITLVPSVNQLDQVIVVGYSSKKARFLSSSVATITNEKLRDVTSNELSNLLQGKAPGVVVSSTSGDPTSAAKVVIRGAGSISAGTSPLYVVDGNIHGTFNPADVESVTVLKDVAATGLYGSRAANGVIIVTTKMGAAGKTVIRVNNTLGFAEATTDMTRIPTCLSTLRMTRQESLSMLALTPAGWDVTAKTSSTLFNTTTPTPKA